MNVPYLLLIKAALGKLQPVVYQQHGTRVRVVVIFRVQGLPMPTQLVNDVAHSETL